MGCDSANARRYGLGLAIGYKNVGFSFGAVEQSVVRLELRGGAEIEEAIIYHAAAEVGQGTDTVMRQMTAEAVGLPLEKVWLVVSDTASSGSSGSVSASRMTFMLGNSIRGAAELTLKKWQDEERPAYVEYAWRAPKTTPYDPQTGKSEPNFAYGYVTEACEVEVDIETGHVRVLRVWCADDVGIAINPGLVRGQIEGAIIQAQGYVLFAAMFIFLGYLGYKKTKTAEDYFVAGRTMGAILIAFSYGATFISAVALIGFSGIASVYGHSILWLAFLNIFVGIFIAFVVYGFRTRKMGLSLNAMTLPEMLGNRFNSTKLQLTSGLIIGVFMMAYTSAVFLAVANLFQVTFGISYELCVVVFTIIVGLSLIAGGLYGVIWTHAVQAILMIIGMLILTVGIYAMLGGIGRKNC